MKDASAELGGGLYRVAEGSCPPPAKPSEAGKRDLPHSSLNNCEKEDKGQWVADGMLTRVCRSKRHER